VFHGGVRLDVLRAMMGWETEDTASLAAELIGTGLATPIPTTISRSNPALCPWLRGQMEAAEREALTAKWVAAMRGFTEFLYQQRFQKNRDRGDAYACLEPAEPVRACSTTYSALADAEAMTTLAQFAVLNASALGKPRLLGTSGGGAREILLRALGKTLESRTVRSARAPDRTATSRSRTFCARALNSAEELTPGGARENGRESLPDTHDYEPPAMAYNPGARRVSEWLQSRPDRQALPWLDDSLDRFESIAAEGQPTAVCPTNGGGLSMPDVGACLPDYSAGLRKKPLTYAYEGFLRRSEKVRGRAETSLVGTGAAWTGSRLRQHTAMPEALQAHEEARERFTRLGRARPASPGSWHSDRSGSMEQAGQPEAAEGRLPALARASSVQLGDVGGTRHPRWCKLGAL
jgi:hypothetical protein